MLLFFLWLEGGHQFGTGDFAIRKDFRWLKKVKCIGAGGHAQIDFLGEALDIFG